MYPAKFENLIASFRRLPGVGQKTAERFAYEALSWDPEIRMEFEKSIHQIPEIGICRICGNICEGELCEICRNSNRNSSTICVVQTSKDVQVLEQTGIFHGVYHVLNGTINTSKGIMPDDLNIDSILNRINEKTNEIILATEPTVDGETTALYLTRLLKDKVKVTRLANGIPMGGRLDYADTRTLQRAFTGRTAADTTE